LSEIDSISQTVLNDIVLSIAGLYRCLSNLINL
jgi:hypothetical protein